jgi:predicted enzyme related to lactoylglutathione lyase
MRTILSAAIIAGVSFIGCTSQNNSGSQSQNVDTTVNKTSDDMKNLISIVEIPTKDFSRARTFYQTILDVKIEETEMGETKIGVFPDTGESISVLLIHGSDYKTSNEGTTVYLNGGDDLQNIARKIEANGGKIIVPKTEIGPDMGFFALFIDTEGNKLGLHSKN